MSLYRENTRDRGKIESFPSFLAAPPRGQVYLFGGAMRFLARDQDSNVLASRGHGTVLSAAFRVVRKKAWSELPCERRAERSSFILSSRRPEYRDVGCCNYTSSQVSFSLMQACILFANLVFWSRRFDWSWVVCFDVCFLGSLIRLFQLFIKYIGL